MGCLALARGSGTLGRDMVVDGALGGEAEGAREEENRESSVMMDGTRNGRLVLEYPCPWIYKVIGRDGEQLRAAIGEIMQEREHLVTPSHTSRTGKYQSLDVEVVVRGEAERTGLYAAFKGHQAVVMVL